MVHTRTARVGSRTVRYLEAGAGWPAVLLHAFPLSADMWRPQLERVPDGWRLLAPDLRGFGPDAAGGAQTLEEMGTDVLEWLDALQVDSAAIGGLSMGGYLALALYRMRPERFQRLVLANTRAAADSPEGREGRDRMLALVRASGPAAVADQMLPKLLGATSLRSRPDLPPLVRRMIEANRTEGIAGAIQAMKDRADSTALLPRITCPVLVIAGVEDTLIPIAESEHMQGAAPRAQLVKLAGAGHLSNLETPDAFSRALEDFLRASL